MQHLYNQGELNQGELNQAKHWTVPSLPKIFRRNAGSSNSMDVHPIQSQAFRENNQNLFS